MLLDPALVWGIVFRGLAALLAVSFASLLWPCPQLPGLLGPRGLYPLDSLLTAVRRDVPSLPRRLTLLPSIVWLVGASDLALTLVASLGLAAALVCVLGTGSSSVLATAVFAVAAACWLSLVSVGSPWFFYPWDALLLEASWLAVLYGVPALPVGGVAALPSSLPSPALALAWRLLLARLMFGMGALKFRPGNARDLMFIKAYLGWQPLPGPLARLMVRSLPDIAYHAALLGMFAIEILLPFPAAILALPVLRVAGFLANTSLMLGIAATGNYGTFNLATILLSVPLLAPPRPLALSSAADAIAVAHALLAMLWLPFSSWTTQVAPYAPLRVSVYPALVTRVLLRPLARLYMVNAYGVFSRNPIPQLGTGARLAFLIEGSDDDGETWRPFPFRWAPSMPHSRLAVFAPYQPRLDHAVFYEAMQVDGAEHSGNNPWIAAAPARVLDRLALRLATREPCVLRLLAEDPFMHQLPSPAPAPCLLIRATRVVLRFAALTSPTPYTLKRDPSLRPVVYRFPRSSAEVVLAVPQAAEFALAALPRSWTYWLQEFRPQRHGAGRRLHSTWPRKRLSRAAAGPM